MQHYGCRRKTEINKTIQEDPEFGGFGIGYGIGQLGFWYQVSGLNQNSGFGRSLPQWQQKRPFQRL